MVDVADLAEAQGAVNEEAREGEADVAVSAVVSAAVPAVDAAVSAAVSEVVPAVDGVDAVVLAADAAVLHLRC